MQLHGSDVIVLHGGVVIDMVPLISSSYVMADKVETSAMENNEAGYFAGCKID